MQTERDAEAAKVIEQQLGASSDIEQVVVKGNVLQVHVSESLYGRLAVDRERGRKIVLALMQQMKRLTGEADVTVWLYVQKEKVIEGKVKAWGGDNVMYLKDL